MNELLVEENIKIEDMIYEIRDKQVILDSDLAKLYHCANGTKTINQAVNRHKDRFPDDFYFQLTKEEYYEILRSQLGTLELQQGKYNKYLPYAFTEEGTAMLASVLRTPIASQVSISIMRAFVTMRKYIKFNNYSQRISNIETTLISHNDKLIEHDNKFEELFDKFEKDANNHIFFENSIYDAYSLLIDILNTSKQSIIIIDNYIDKKLLDICSKIKSKITIYTNKINQIDLEKYNKQYKNIEIKITKSFHDRFIIIDNKKLYHSGASFKDLGKKCFALSKIENEKILYCLLKNIA